MKRSLKSMVAIFSLFVFLVSCTDSGKSKKQDKLSITQTEVTLNEWKTDSLGCKRIRTKELAEKLVIENSLEEKTISDFENIFGKPNKSEVVEEAVIFSYYFNAMCRNNKFLDTADYCVAEFRFVQDALSRRNYICF